MQCSVMSRPRPGRLGFGVQVWQEFMPLDNMELPRERPSLGISMTPESLPRAGMSAPPLEAGATPSL